MAKSPSKAAPAKKAAAKKTPTKAVSKAPAKKAAAKKAPVKPAAAAKAAPKPRNSALTKPMHPSPQLGAVVGTAPLSRADAVSRVWIHIKRQNLQNPANKREILADDKLKAVFGKDKVTMFEMNKYLAKHLT